MYAVNPSLTFNHFLCWSFLALLDFFFYLGIIRTTCRSEGKTRSNIRLKLHKNKIQKTNCIQKSLRIKKNIYFRCWSVLTPYDHFYLGSIFWMVSRHALNQQMSRSGPESGGLVLRVDQKWVRSIIPTAHNSDSPLLRQPITPTAHYSDNPLFRQPIVPTANNLAQQRNFFMTSGPGKQTTIDKTIDSKSCRRSTRTDDEI